MINDFKEYDVIKTNLGEVLTSILSTKDERTHMQVTITQDDKPIDEFVTRDYFNWYRRVQGTEEWNWVTDLEVCSEVIDTFKTMDKLYAHSLNVNFDIRNSSIRNVEYSRLMDDVATFPENISRIYVTFWNDKHSDKELKQYPDNKHLDYMHNEDGDWTSYMYNDGVKLISRDRLKNEDVLKMLKDETVTRGYITNGSVDIAVWTTNSHEV